MSERIFNNRYRLEGRLGDGGMAVVYSGTDTLLRRRVAIKVLREQYAADEDFVRRFYHEAQAAARLSHPNVVNVFDVGHEGASYYIVMELVEGAPLSEMIKADGKLPERVAIDYAAQVCQGLAYAHRQGFLHRDIKPANILVTSDDVVKLSDFGIARAVSQHTMTMTQPGMVMGSVYYFSPEQAQGRELHESSDLYSVGVVLYQMLTGELPYTADSAISVALKHINEPIPAMDDPALGISPALAAVIRKLLHKDPEARFQSASEVATALREARERPTVAAYAGSDAPTTRIAATTPPPPRRSQRPDNGATTGMRAVIVDAQAGEEDLAPESRRRNFIALAALLLVAIVAGYLVYNTMPILGPRIKVADYTGMNSATAQRELVAANLNVKITQEPSESVPADIVIRQDPAAAAEVPASTVVELFVSSGLPLVDVPDVRNFSSADAARLLTQAKLRMKLVKRFDKSPKDNVISQNPAPPLKTRENSVVTIVVSAGLKPVAVPNVVSMKLADATAALKKLGLLLEVYDRQPSDNIPADTIASQDPNGGTQVDVGAKISVVISSGPASAAVPDVTSRPMEEALSALRGAGFRPAITYTTAGPDASAAVISQTPPAGTSAPRGSQVSIVVAVSGVVPDVNGLSLDAARAKLQAAGYRVGNVAQTQQGAEGKVVRTEPEANTTLSPGESVNLIFNAPGQP